MRDLRRNQQTVWYALLSESVGEDEWGNTDNIKDYGKPQSIKMSISENKREMSTHDMNCPIDEYTHLWLDGRDITMPHNYEVAAVSKSLNCIRYAIRRVNVS